MKKILFTTTSIIFSFILSACASNNIPKNANTSFLTRISESGLKHFQIQIKPNKKKEAQKKPSRKRNQRSARSNKSQFKETQKFLLSAAKEKNAEIQFCREGFWVLKNDADAIRPYLRGECNDQASIEDRKTFPQTLLRW